MILCDCKEDLSIAAEELIPLFFILNIKAGALFLIMLHATGKKTPIQSDFYKEESYVVIQGIQNICGPRGSLSYYIVIHGTT